MITHTIPTSLAQAGEIIPIPVTLAWDPMVPVRVTASFTVSGGTVPWELSLESLRLGVHTVFPHQIGRGDVAITSDADSVILFLNSPEGNAVVLMDYAKVREFLDSVTLANVTEEASMLALVDAFLVTLNTEAF